MKHIILFLLLIISTVSVAQSRRRLETRISDDGQILLIGIDAHKNGRDIHYEQTFDVSDMNGLQIDWLKYQVFSSQGVTVPLGEVKRLFTVVVLLVGFVLLWISSLIVRYQSRKTTLPKLTV